MVLEVQLIRSHQEDLRVLTAQELQAVPLTLLVLKVPLALKLLEPQGFQHFLEVLVLLDFHLILVLLHFHLVPGLPEVLWLLEVLPDRGLLVVLFVPLVLQHRAVQLDRQDQANH